jgi:hypothetical protein
MTLDEQLRRAFDTLADRLRDDMAAHAKSLVDELTATAEAERADAVAEAAKDAWSTAERQAAERLTSSVAATETAVRADAERRETAAAERLLAAIQTLDRGQSLSDILNALVDGAAAEAKRAAMFLRKGERLQSWRVTGFGETTRATSLDLSLSESGSLGEAARSGLAVRSSPAPAFAALPPERQALSIPLVMSGQVFAVLYADQGTGDAVAGDAWMATLEVLTRHAARALEAVTAVRLAQVAAERAKLPEGQVRIRN